MADLAWQLPAGAVAYCLIVWALFEMAGWWFTRREQRRRQHWQETYGR